MKMKEVRLYQVGYVFRDSRKSIYVLASSIEDAKQAVESHVGERVMSVAEAYSVFISPEVLSNG